MKTYFAVIPDGQTQPAAVFAQLEDAIDWGVGTIGQNRFSIRGVQGVASDWAEGVVPAAGLPAN
ncbi:MAG: hypothetical protein SF187_00615 [Deltaproteobacteria bacterium]|nr:hypothetical protein [Deltaproteobacteria bacterium]